MTIGEPTPTAPQAASGAVTRPHVVMVVANDITNDSRVRKEAVAIARAGARVTLLGLASDGQQSMGSLDGGALMVRIPAAFQLRNERIRRRRARRIWRLPLVGYRTGQAQASRRKQIAARLGDVKADSGHAVAARRAGKVGLLRYKAGVLARTFRHRRWQLALLGTRLRAGITRRESRLIAAGWRLWDGLVARTTWPARWRGVLPDAYDYEIAFGDLIDKLAPDVVHAHDMHVVGVAARAAGRAPLHRRHRLDREPTVVINAPSLSDISAEVTDLRSRLGLAREVPLLVYSGGVTRARGVETAIEALVHLPGVHLAVVCVPSTAIGPVRELRALAESLDITDRVHCVDPVEPHEVVAYLRSADVGLIPILRYPSHEMSLPNKVFEYIFAGLPVLASNMPSLTEFIARSGIGEVFEVENPADLAAKVTKVLDAPEGYRERLSRPEFQHDVSWEGQADLLRNLYADLLGRPLMPVAETGRVDLPAPATPHLLIGPSNSAEQAWQWARALERWAAPIVAESMCTEANAFAYRAHRTATYEQYRTDLLWQFELASYVLGNVTHVLFEAGRPIFGQLPGQLFDKDLPTLTAAGIAHGVVFHGSEVRNPRQHRARYRYSPFAAERSLTERLQKATDLIQQRLADYGGARFVTTPDLLEYVENSQWLPVVVDPDELASPHPVLDRRIPVVLHAPSRSALKGSAYVDPVLEDLDSRGRIEYRRVEGVPHSTLMELVREADIVVDQLLLGSYGVTACEAMAAGRVTVGHVAEHVRELLPMDLPIVEATPDDLADVIEELVSERGPAIKIAGAGPDYVRHLHDGRESVQALLPFLQG